LNEHALACFMIHTEPMQLIGCTGQAACLVLLREEGC
jgi:hypothetical protein